MSPQPTHDQSPGWRDFAVYAVLVGLAVAAIVFAIVLKGWV